jgi:hypothetical protein
LTVATRPSVGGSSSSSEVAPPSHITPHGVAGHALLPAGAGGGVLYGGAPPQYGVPVGAMIAMTPTAMTPSHASRMAADASGGVGFGRGGGGGGGGATGLHHMPLVEIGYGGGAPAPAMWFAAGAFDQQPSGSGPNVSDGSSDHDRHLGRFVPARVHPSHFMTRQRAPGAAGEVMSPVGLLGNEVFAPSSEPTATRRLPAMLSAPTGSHPVDAAASLPAYPGHGGDLRALAWATADDAVGGSQGRGVMIGRTRKSAVVQVPAPPAQSAAVRRPDGVPGPSESSWATGNRAPVTVSSAGGASARAEEDSGGVADGAV